MGNKLTAKQEAFATKYVECDDASEAYRFAYNCKSMSKKSINEEGCKLLSHPKISPRIQELQNKIKKIAEDKFTISIERRLKWLEEITLAGLSVQLKPIGDSFVEQRENLAASNQAIKTLNEMLGTDEKGDKVKPVKVFVGVQDAS